MKQSSLHAAIIMDGNRRWAMRSGLPVTEGHRLGAESLRRIVESAPRCGIGVLTVYTFSSDNWKRPPEEVAALMMLLTDYLEHETEQLKRSGVRTTVIGRRDRLPQPLLSAIIRAEAETKECSRLHFRLAIDYSARAAIHRAIENEEYGARFLAEALPVDLLIRTGGEQRLSDFLLWESAYAELFFSQRMWPEFRPADLLAAVNEYHRRDRRFGGAASAPLVPTRAERWLS